MKKFFSQRSWFFMLPVFLLLAGSAPAAQFSALMMIKDGDRLVSGKIYVQDALMRQEFTDAEGQTVTIVRPDQKVIWFIMPLERAYVEMPLKKLPGQFIQIPKEALTKRLVGKETVNGYEAEKYEVSVRGGGGLEKQTIWVATKLGTPVKLIAKERNFSVEYKSIKEGAQAERLFNLPPGYKKLVSPDLLPSWKGY